MKIKTLFILLLISSSVFSQIDDKKWTTITEYENNLESVDFAPDASAVILSDIEKLEFDNNMNGRRLFILRKRHLKIKILKKEGLKFANVQIPYKNLARQGLVGEISIYIKAKIYNGIGKGSITKIKKKNISHRDSSNYMSIAEFTFPGAKVGSIIEYAYTIVGFELLYPQSKQFSADIPVLHSEFIAKIPSNMTYVFSAPLIHEFDKQTETSYTKTLLFPLSQRRTSTYRFDLSGTECRFVLKNIEAQLPSQDGFEGNFKLNMHILKIVQHSDIEAWKYYAGLIMRTTYPEAKNRTVRELYLLPFPSGYVYKTKSWKELAEDIIRNEEFGLPTKKNIDLPFLDSLKAASTSNNEKIKKTYEYIKEKTNWNNEYSVYLPVDWKNKNLSTVINKDEASSSEINLLLYSCLKLLDVEAYPILVNTRDIGNVDPIITDLDQFNTVNVLVKTEDQTFVLDASNSESSYYKLAKELNNRVGFVVKNEEYEWFKVE